MNFKFDNYLLFSLNPLIADRHSDCRIEVSGGS